MKQVFSIDWLNVYAREPYPFQLSSSFFRSNGLLVREREFGTPQFHEMFSIVDDRGHVLLEIRRRPKSLRGDGGIFEEGDVHVRLSNYSCYGQNPAGFLRDFLAKWNYTYKSISRVDICCDFDAFSDNRNPREFLREYVEGHFCKINQARVCAHGEDQFNDRYWNSVSWGSPTSCVRTKMYNKSQEMRSVKAKAWILHRWRQAGLLDTSSDIWRVEFSISGTAKNMKYKDRSFVLSLSDIEDMSKIRLIFLSLVERYFYFVTFVEGVRKYRCPRVKLFDIDLNTLISFETYQGGKEASPLPPRFLSMCAQIMNSDAYVDKLRSLCEQIYYLERDYRDLYKGGKCGTVVPQ